MENKIIQISDKSYKESDVVMLATNRSRICIVTNGKSEENFLTLADNNALWKSQLYDNGGEIIPQHLYFLSNDEIKEGDWKYNEKLKTVDQHKREGKNLPDEMKVAASWCKKIIASTDESLGLSRPSDDFLKLYCKKDGISKVLIEYEESRNVNSPFYGTVMESPSYKLKVVLDNTVSIKPLIVKDSWTADEVVHFTSCMISQFKSGNTNIENKSILMESLMSAL